MPADDLRAEPFRWVAVAAAAVVGLMHVLGACVVLGPAPMIPTAVSIVAPGVVSPGSECDGLTWVLIPPALARATVLRARSRRAATTPTR